MVKPSPPSPREWTVPLGKRTSSTPQPDANLQAGYVIPPPFSQAEKGRNHTTLVGPGSPCTLEPAHPQGTAQEVSLHPRPPCEPTEAESQIRQGEGKGSSRSHLLQLLETEEPEGRGREERPSAGGTREDRESTWQDRVQHHPSP